MIGIHWRSRFAHSEPLGWDYLSESSKAQRLHWTLRVCLVVFAHLMLVGDWTTGVLIKHAQPNMIPVDMAVSDSETGGNLPI